MYHHHVIVQEHYFFDVAIVQVQPMWNVFLAYEEIALFYKDFDNLKSNKNKGLVIFNIALFMIEINFLLC